MLLSGHLEWSGSGETHGVFWKTGRQTDKTLTTHREGEADDERCRE